MAFVEWMAAGLIFVAGIFLGAVLMKRKSLGQRKHQLAEAQMQFHRMREQLEAKFLQKRGTDRQAARAALGRLRI